MQIVEMSIINHKGIRDANILFNSSMSFLVSGNNVGKTRVLEAIDAFYHYSNKIDSEIEISYKLNEDDIKSLDPKLSSLVSSGNILKVKLKDKKRTIDETNVDSFYKKKVFGEVIYIPAVSNHNDETNIGKTNAAIFKMIDNLAKAELSGDLKLVNDTIKNYVESLNKSTKGLMDEISQDLVFDDIAVLIENIDIDNSQLLKNNMVLKTLESKSAKPSDIQNLGSGIQRNIVNAILTKYHKYDDGFSLILYDEPETFISTFSQRSLICNINNNLNSSNNLQYIVATHSPDVIYRNKDIHKKIIRL